MKETSGRHVTEKGVSRQKLGLSGVQKQESRGGHSLAGKVVSSVETYGV